jgi:hypothetical protein
MNRLVNRIMVGLAVITVLGAIALADRKADTVTFAGDVKLGGATVKAGTYKVQFDYKTNELSIINGTKSVATATGHVEQAQRKARATEVETTSRDNGDVVTAVTFGGDNRKIVIDGGSSDAKTGSR